ncbi:hypothetical protein [Streptomyces sp. NPDC059072]|uniref:hypothetical protein n=1 Tax=Streptomyces sp. NPDC059072 TaxID=3346715 RepID=UPI00369B47BF
MTDTVGQPDPGRVPPRPTEPPSVAPYAATYPAPAHAPAPAPAPSGHPPRWAWWVIGIVVPVVGTVATLFATSAKNDPATPPAASGAAPATAGSASPRPSPQASSPSPSVSETKIAPLPGPSSASPSPSGSGPDLTAPAGYQTQQGRWGIAPPPCGETQLVDLDAGVSTTVKVKYAGEGPTTEQTAAIELEYRPDSLGCGNAGDASTYVKLMTTTGRQVGVLRAGQAQTFENCRAAAGTGFGPVQLGGSDAQGRGIVKGAALCSVTDRGSVAMALVEESSKEYSPTVSGRLIVWSKG